MCLPIFSDSSTSNKGSSDGYFFVNVNLKHKENFKNDFMKWNTLLRESEINDLFFR